ncbi:MAG: ABC transporter permease [Planctomycetota bacterium]|nr:ABC transporter permease [Planctomycetota bacterium]
MTTSETPAPGIRTPGPIRRGVARVGRPAVETLEYLGGVAGLTLDAGRWLWRSVVLREVRFGRRAAYAQVVRVGVRSIGVITLVSSCIGLILVLQVAPLLDNLGQTEMVANVVGLAIFRELGPLIGAIVLTGFAGASIAAELGTMVVGEEVEALEAHALNPVRFLVLPRVLATIISMVVLCVLGDVIAVFAGGLIGVLGLGIGAGVYFNNTIDQLVLADFLTGVWKAGVFGAIMGTIACYNGLSVTGGAAGVGRATTNTVVHSIVSIIIADLIFTAVFFRLGWN